MDLAPKSEGNFIPVFGFIPSYPPLVPSRTKMEPSFQIFGGFVTTSLAGPGAKSRGSYGDVLHLIWIVRKDCWNFTLVQQQNFFKSTLRRYRLETPRPEVWCNACSHGIPWNGHGWRSWRYPVTLLCAHHDSSHLSTLATSHGASLVDRQWLFSVWTTFLVECVSWLQLAIWN